MKQYINVQLDHIRTQDHRGREVKHGYADKRTSTGKIVVERCWSTFCAAVQGNMCKQDAGGRAAAHTVQLAGVTEVDHIMGMWMKSPQNETGRPRAGSRRQDFTWVHFAQIPLP